MVDERRKDGDIYERVVRVETQIGRIVSDAESEKDTRKRVNQDIFERFKELGNEIGGVKRSIWIATGAISAVIFFINLWAKHL